MEFMRKTDLSTFSFYGGWGALYTITIADGFYQGRPSFYFKKTPERRKYF